MTQPDVQLEYDELMQRADELDVPFPDPPPEHPAAPCELQIVTDAAAVLAQSVDNLLTYLAAGAHGRRDLATSLRNTAKAYETTDEEGAKSVTGGGSPSSAAGGEDEDAPPSHGGQMMMASNPFKKSSWEEWFGMKGHKLKEPTTTPDDYADLKTRAEQIGKPDQGTAFRRCVTDWNAYRTTLIDSLDLYRGFTYWKGEAAESVEATLRAMREWTLDTADACSVLVDQAHYIADAHKVAVGEHPTLAQIEDAEALYNKGGVANHIMAMQQYQDYQTKSDAAIQKYTTNGRVPIGTLMPGEPPPIHIVDPPPGPTPAPTPTPTPTPFFPDISDFTGPTTPTTPGSALSGFKGPDTEEMGDTSEAGTNAPLSSGVKAASADGGSFASALKPAAGGEALLRPSAPSDGSGLGRAGLGAGAGFGGSGMGTGAMGRGGGDEDGTVWHGDEEELLYREDRPWTEGVIGALPPKGVPENYRP